MMYLLYWGLLVAWVLLLWPAFQLQGTARNWLLVVIAAGIVALVYETYMYLWSFANIRLDILLISMALGCLYCSALALLVVRQLRTSAALLASVLVVTVGGMSYKWIEVGRESRQLGEIIDETNRLLFQAKFRSPEIYESQFGPFAGASEGSPTGHWQIEGRSRYTRLIINAKGRIWLFYQCQEDAECHSGPGGSGLRKIGGQPGVWSASLKPPVGLPFDIKITREQPNTLLVEVYDQIHRFSKAPPPVDPAPAVKQLRFLGPFSHLECSGAHARIRQVWLWEDGAHLHAVGIFSTLIADRQDDFVPSVVMGEGARHDDGWHFAWQQHGRSGIAIIQLKERSAILTLDEVGRDLEDADKLALQSGGVFGDERIELAPLTSSEDWRHWFDNVLTGHFVSGYAPAC